MEDLKELASFIFHPREKIGEAWDAVKSSRDFWTGEVGGIIRDHVPTGVCYALSAFMPVTWGHLWQGDPCAGIAAFAGYACTIHALCGMARSCAATVHGIPGAAEACGLLIGGVLAETVQIIIGAIAGPLTATKIILDKIRQLVRRYLPNLPDPPKSIPEILRHDTDADTRSEKDILGDRAKDRESQDDASENPPRGDRPPKDTTKPNPPTKPNGNDAPSDPPGPATRSPGPPKHIDLPEADRKRRESPGCSTDVHSFDPETLVLMADGTTKAIKDIRNGDRVIASDPETGQTTVQTVTDLHVNLDRELTTITLTPLADEPTTITGEGNGDRSTRGPTATLETTQNHPFWDVTSNSWVNAADLVPGKSIVTSPTGDQQLVTAVNNHTGAAEMRDLTVATVHTYYVLAGDTPVLVHNDGGWTIDPAKSTAAMRGGPFGAMYYRQIPDSKGDVYWWSPDKKGDGGSAWKVFRETSKGLQWVADADINGDYMPNKHKGPVGRTIPFSDLNSVKVTGLGSALGGCP